MISADEPPVILSHIQNFFQKIVELADAIELLETVDRLIEVHNGICSSILRIQRKFGIRLIGFTDIPIVPQFHSCVTIFPNSAVNIACAGHHGRECENESAVCHCEFSYILMDFL